MENTQIKDELANTINHNLFYKVYASVLAGGKYEDDWKYLQSCIDKWNEFRFKVVFYLDYDSIEIQNDIRVIKIGMYTDLGIYNEDEDEDEDIINTYIPYTNELLEYMDLHDDLKSGEGFFCNLNTFRDDYTSSFFDEDEELPRNLGNKVVKELKRIDEGRKRNIPSKENMVDMLNGTSFYTDAFVTFYKEHDIVELKYTDKEPRLFSHSRVDTFDVEIIVSTSLFGLSKKTIWLFGIKYKDLIYL